MSSKIILPCPFRRGRIWRTGPEKPKASHTILHVCALVMTVFGKSVMTFGLYERKYVAGSIPASQSRAAFVDNVILFPPLGSIDSLAPARSPRYPRGHDRLGRRP